MVFSVGPAGGFAKILAKSKFVITVGPILAVLTSMKLPNPDFDRSREMTICNRLAYCLPCLGLAAVLAPSTNAHDGSGVHGTTLVAVALQDEPRKLPKDITAMLTRADRRVRFELVKLSGDSSQSLAGTSITVIDSSGQSKQVVADQNGVATLEGAQPGLHAVVIGSEQGHSAIPMAVREAPENAPPASGPATLKLPLVDVEPREVISLARSVRPMEGAATYSDIDNDFVTTGLTGDSYGYRFRLGSQGELVGQVISLVREGVVSADVEGTNVMLYSGSRLAGQAVADQRGFFEIPALAPGTYGLVAVGPGGYAAFALEAQSARAVARNSVAGAVTLVSTMTQIDGDVVPVFLVPSPMVPAVVSSLEQSYGPLINGGADAGLGGLGGLSALAPGLSGGGSSGGASAGAGGVGGGMGGLGALASIGAIGAVAAAAAEDSDDDEPGTNASISDVIIIVDEDEEEL